MRPDVNINTDSTNNNTHGNSHDNTLGQCELPLAQSSIGMQMWREIYERDKALMRGTIFCELDKPFRGSER